jgi:hypothetical protein
MLRLFTGLYLFHTVTSTIVSDSGCHCALQKNATTTPSAAASATVGCSYKTDWTGQPSKWCLTDQTAAFCGTNQTNFGFVDSCATAGFTSIVVGSPATSALGHAFFTGQNLTINWTTQNILSDETIKITYLRTSFTSPNTGYAMSRIADALSSVTAGTNITLSTVSSPAVSTNGTQPFSIILSAVTGITVTNNVTLVAQGTQVQILGQNLTVAWTGVGQGALGAATVTLKSNGGGGGGTTVGTPLTLAQVGVNNSVPYLIPRSFSPGFGGTTYSVTIRVTNPDLPAPYTATGISFSLVAGPSVTPTNTPTPTQTPTASLSFGATSSVTPSRTPTLSFTSTITPSGTPTPTQTPSPSLSFGTSASATPAGTPSGSPSASMTPSLSSTISLTPTSTPPINLAAIAANASQQATSALVTIIGSIMGSLVALCVAGLIAYKVNQRRQLREKRLRTIAVSKRMDDMTRVYGVVIQNPGALNQYSARAMRSPRTRNDS